MRAPVAATSLPCPETWSAWLCVSRTCSIVTPLYRASSRYSSISKRGSITAAIPARSSPTRYEAHPRSSWVIWRKIIVLCAAAGAAALYLTPRRRMRRPSPGAVGSDGPSAGGLGGVLLLEPAREAGAARAGERDEGIALGRLLGHARAQVCGQLRRRRPRLRAPSPRGGRAPGAARPCGRPGPARAPKCGSASRSGLQPSSTSSEERHASRSMSGGGVGGMTTPGASRTPATSPGNATPLSWSRKATWCQAWPGVHADAKRSICMPSSITVQVRLRVRGSRRRRAPRSDRRTHAARWRPGGRDRSGEARPRGWTNTFRSGQRSTSAPAAPAWSKWMWVSSSSRGLRPASAARRLSMPAVGPQSIRTSPESHAPIISGRPS